MGRWGGVCSPDNLESAVQGRIYRAPNSTGSTGCQCDHLAECVRTPYPAATSLWRLTPVINQPLCKEKGWVTLPTHPLVAQIPEGSTFSIAWALLVLPRTSRERLHAELLPVILKGFAGRCATGSASNEPWNQGWDQPLEGHWND